MAQETEGAVLMVNKHGTQKEFPIKQANAIIRQGALKNKVLWLPHEDSRFVVKGTELAIKSPQRKSSSGKKKESNSEIKGADKE